MLLNFIAYLINVYVGLVEEETVLKNLYWTQSGAFVMYYNISMTFTQAIQYCSGTGGSLASVANSAENTLLGQTLADNG